MSASVVQHPTDEMLELYSLLQLSPESCDVVEEHLLVCHPCQDRLMEVDRFIAAMKQACHESAIVDTPRVNRPFARFVSLPTPVWAMAAIAVLLMATLPFVRSAALPVPETEIHLLASRGAEGSYAAASRLRLTIDTTQLPPYSSYRVEIVSLAGDPVWHSDVRPAASLLSLQVPIRLKRGQYWVRVSGPASELLREFSLKLT